jgi:polar amino acid transport system ATP-binding protein
MDGNEYYHLTSGMMCMVLGHSHPKVMLYDEVTSALDPELVAEVLRVIRQLALEGMTMIIVTHEIYFARDVGDRIMFMDGGVIVEQGPPSQILANPSAERLKPFLRRYQGDYLAA